jgi:hypothetical protein
MQRKRTATQATRILLQTTLGLTTIFGLAAASSPRANAQDTRTVTEPTFPAACAVLSSQLAIAAGEPASETAFDTSRIQTALNACPTGQAVELVVSGTNNAFLIQPITLPTGVTLLVDGGVTVFASRNPADYQISGKETCGTVGTAGNGCNPLFNVNSGNTSTGAGIMGYGVIDGRGEDKLLVNGVASTNSWWDIANQAQTAGGAQNNFITLAASKAANFTLYKITFRNSAMFHVKWQGADGFTAWGVKVATPYTARNSDGIDPSGSDITVTNSSISDGDDNVALSASSATANITISNDNTYSGHGISVGSYTQGGLTNMLVSNINQAGTAADGNGIALRIKSALDRGGTVQNVTYQNICMQNHKTLLDIDPFYNSNAGTLVPLFSNITFQNVHGLTAGTITLEGHDVNHPTTITLNNVVFDSLAQSNISPAFSYDTITLGPGPVSPTFLQSQTGTGVAYMGNVSSPGTAPYPCSASTFTYLVGELYLSTASTTNQKTLTNVPGPGTVTLNAVLATAMSQVTYGAYTGTAAPTAAVQFREGNATVGSGTLSGNGTLATLSLTGVTTGPHTYTAYYPGDTTYAAYPFGSVTVMVIPTAVASSTALTAAPAAVQAGSSTVLTATVTGHSLAAGPTGMVNFLDGTTVIGSGMLNPTTDQATYTATLNGVTTHNLTAVYLGDPNDATSTSPAVPVAASAIPTMTNVSLSSATVATGSNTTVTATVTATSGVPAGTVTFYNGTTSIGTGTLSNGVATVTVSSSSMTAQSISASYAATGNYGGSTSSAISLNFANAFTLAPAAYQVALGPGKSTTVAVTATPASGFTGTITFACASPVAYVTCAMTPATATATGGAAVQSTVTVSVVATTSQLRGAPFDNLRRGGQPGLQLDSAIQTARLRQPKSERGSAPLAAILLPIGGLALLGFTRKSSRTRRYGVLLACLVTLCTLAGLSGCSSTPAAGTLPVGPEKVTITATSGTTSASTTVTVNVTQ